MFKGCVIEILAWNLGGQIEILFKTGQFRGNKACISSSESAYFYLTDWHPGKETPLYKKLMGL